MNIENELKLIPNKEVSEEQVIKMLAKKGIVIQKEGKMVHQEDTYFDDKDGTLEKSGGSFRIRRKKDKIAVTYKMPIESDTEYKQRKEYEITVPGEYMETGIDMQTAIELLKKQYPEIEFPEDMGEILTVINDRKRTNLVCPDGAIIEMAFDSLQGKDGDGEIYHIQPEIEFETIEGNPENLTTIYETINEEFPEQTSKNTLSKYARTKKEITEQKLTLEELSACALFTQILRSTQFDKLKYKGQILHRYDKPTIPQLDNFKDFDYLVNRIKAIKKGEYKIQVPESVIEKEGIADLLQSGTYEIKDEINLEDMFCLLLSDVNYRVADEVLVDFLDKVYYADDKAITNRLSHSQQVMLGTGLTCKSSQVKTSLGERLTCMISALSHDIGHVPLSHTMEKVIDDEEGLFSHETNGKRVVNTIYNLNKSEMIRDIQRYIQGSPNYEIEDILENKKNEIGKAIEEHSRTNSETRGNGPNVQIPRACDKICYVVSDIRDLTEYAKSTGESIDILQNDWIKESIEEIFKERPYFHKKRKEVLNSGYIDFIKNGDYGRALVNTINSITMIRHGGHQYYDVNQDIWNFMIKLIERTKQTRKSMGIEGNKGKMKQMARFLLLKVTNQYLREFKGDKEKAKWAAIDYITNMGEIDLLDYAKKVTVVSDKQLTGKQPITDAEMRALKNQICVQVQNACIASGKTKKEASQEIQKIQEQLKKLSSEEIISLYSRFCLTQDSEIENIKSIKKTEDTQLKLRQTPNLTIEDILIELGIADGDMVSKKIYDRYYQTGTPGRTVRVRRIQGQDTQTLTVKDNIHKNVKELSRKRNDTVSGQDLTVEEMIDKINAENPGLNVSILSNIPLKELEIRRTEYIRNVKGEQVIISNDSVTSAEGKTIREIEIKCPESSKLISYLKKRLQEIFGNKVKFTKQPKVSNFIPTTHSSEDGDLR